MRIIDMRHYLSTTIAANPSVVAKFLSPTWTVILIWAIAASMFLIGSASLGDLEYFSMLADQEGLVPEFGLKSLIWLLAALLTFATGCFFGSSSFYQSTTVLMLDHRRAVKIVLFLFASTTVTAAIWVGGAIVKFGGLLPLMELAESANQEAREVILDGVFPGARLVASGFVGVAVLSATILASGGPEDLTQKQRMSIGFILLFSLAYLGAIPILLSGRIHFFAALIGCFVSASLIRRKFIGIRYWPFLIGTAALVWGLKQQFSLGHISEASVFTQATEGLLFYFYNDFSNAVTPIENIEGSFAYGWNSLRFVFFFTGTQDFARESAMATSLLKTAGEFPLFAATYMDFGPFGLLILVAIGFASGYSHTASNSSALYSAIYGLVFSGLILSIHSAYITYHDLVYNLILVSFALRLATYRVISQY